MEHVSVCACSYDRGVLMPDEPCFKAFQDWVRSRLSADPAAGD